jgi:cytochrome b involved in lipid metabolism
MGCHSSTLRSGAVGSLNQEEREHREQLIREEEEVAGSIHRHDPLSYTFVSSSLEKGLLLLRIDDVVYDATLFAGVHPGGRYPLVKHAGKECGEIFNRIHSRKAKMLLQNYRLGLMKGPWLVVAST